MNMAKPRSPWEILAWAVVVIAAGWAVDLLLQGLAVFVEALGASVGIGIAAAAGGAVSVAMIAPWLIDLATALVGMAGFTIIYRLAKTAVTRADEDPFAWILPAIGILAAFFVDLTQDAFASEAERAIYALVTGLLAIVGGLLVRRRGLTILVGLLLPFVPTVAVVASLAERRRLPGSVVGFLTSGSITEVGVLGSILMALVVVVLGLCLPKRGAAEAHLIAS